MKKVIGILTVFVAIIGFTSMALSIGELKFEKETHDFGTIPYNKPASYDFKFTNTGTAPIILSEVRPSCGCSVAEFTKTPIKPEESGTISVTYNAATKGPFTKQFTVKSNTKTPVKTLTVKGTVE
ncbi:DUF1573 domain-containing protein [Sphingobacterium sp. UT-1RO-CII-1]|uniref:DUF1573 domain-containing protein n=1 Tax=Sphingobacterium sp. UT-1RO-CII-1 TaxID=2995225 RepID=UPI00227C43FE|nr:DUF1573 domain-containing protein [Sphingobacterium sp. UT-1RO-CII-1]MCY4781333.1 DUF1573 domain-containing protein [Sphingobacterium sp. UT-1RO-CII-1]